MNSFGVTTGTEKREPAALHPIQHKIQGSLQENGTATTGDPTAGTPASSSVPGTPGLIQRQHRWVRGRRLGEETEPWQLSSLHVLCLTVVSTVGHKLHKGVAKFSTKLKQSKHRLSSFFVRHVTSYFAMQETGIGKHYIIQSVSIFNPKSIIHVNWYTYNTVFSVRTSLLLCVTLLTK